MNRKRFSWIKICLLLVVVLGIGAKAQTVTAENVKSRVIVTGYEVSNNDVTPGEKFTLTYRIKNMNPVHPVYSVLMTIGSSSENIYPVYGQSDQIYVEALQPNEEVPIKVQLKAAANLEVLSVDYPISLSYFDDIEGTTSNQTILQIPIGQESMLAIQNYSVAETSTVGTGTRVSVSYQNIGVEKLQNVQLHVKVKGMEEQVFSIGNVDVQESNNKETYLMFSDPGEKKVTLRLTYEDEKGNTYKSDKIEAKIQVNGASLSETVSGVQDAAPQQISKKMVVAVGVVCVVAIAGAILIVKRKRK